MGSDQRPIIVAIDGPAGAGKSTVARGVARELGFAMVDTGAIYRCVGLTALQRAVPLDDQSRLAELVETLQIRFEPGDDGVQRVWLNDDDVTRAIRTPEVSQAASAVAASPAVRQGLLELQRRLALDSPTPGAVLEGRDIGTVVFPDADAKFFVTADPRERARRRQTELAERGVSVTLDQVLAEQDQRDANVSNRQVAPLRAADDAIEVDTTQMSIEQVIGTVVSRVRALQ